MNRYARFEATPPSTAIFLKDILWQKTVFDIGAGDGAWAEAMAKYAKEVVCVEIDAKLSVLCEKRGLSVISKDFTVVPLDRAEILYCYMSHEGMSVLRAKVNRDNWHGTIISNTYPLGELKPSELIIATYKQGEVPFLIYLI